MTAYDLLPLAFFASACFAIDRLARLVFASKAAPPRMEQVRARHRAVYVELVQLGLNPESKRNPAAMEYALALCEELNALRVQMATMEGRQ